MDMKNIILLSILLSSLQLNGQISYFSQYASAPLHMNPANTGLIKGTWRAAANYRNDWNSVIIPFVTSSFSYDMNLFKEKLNKSYLGIGVFRTDRVAGDGNEEIRLTGISLAYHRVLNKDIERPSTLSVGLQSVLVQKGGEIHSLYYGPSSHVKSGIYNLDPYLDYNAGLMFTGYVNQRLSFYSGFSYEHFTQPLENILGDYYKVQAKVSAQIGGEYTLSKKGIILFSGLYEQQGKAYDVQIGGALGYNLSTKEEMKRKQLHAYLGAWYKYNEALVPYLGLDFYGFRLGVSADIKHGLTEASQGVSFELSLMYNGGKNNPVLKNQAYFPRF